MAHDTLPTTHALPETVSANRRPDLLHRLFEARAEEKPGREALVWGEVRTTYGELARRADRLARRLAALGIGPEVPVGVCSRRSPEMVVGMLAVLKAGGAYLPLDPKYPRERLRFMLEDAGAPVVLTDSESSPALPRTRARLVFLDAPEDGESGGPLIPATPDNLAYLIYTSGSTGRPKGVAIPHKAAVHLMHWARGLFPPEDLAGVLAATSICFDLSVFEIFVPLSWGGRVILADNALSLPTLPAASEVTLVNTVPSAANELVLAGGFPPSVRTINLAGEALQRALVDQLYRTTSARAVFNLYGPSEDTTYSTWALVPPDSDEAPTIGLPLPEETGHVLNADLLAVPGGQEGELYLGGPALARGYLARPDLTAERFLPDPFSTEPGARMYKTGDLVRLRPDGEFDFLGRIDHQVKIRGFRIELGEVEAALLAVPGVKSCVAVAIDARLVAYVAPDDVQVPELRRSLSARLPAHMVPSAFVLLPALPLTPNGKVDRKALPAPGRVRPDVGRYAAPREEVEARLAELWAEALGLEAVGIEDDFFELGGHSLLAGRLLSRVRQAFGADRSVRDLFAAPTVSAFAARLRESAPAKEIPLAAGEGELPLSLGQERLLFLHRMEAEPITHNVGLIGILKGDLDVSALRRALTEIVRRHEPLRTVYSDVQVILPPAEVPLPVHDLSGEEAVRRFAWEEHRRPLDLERGPVLRAALLRMGPREHRLVLTVHHITWDDGSLAALLRELPVLYRAFAEGSEPSLPPLPVRYADFAAWQRARLQGETLDSMADRWVKQLFGLPEPLDLPTDRPRPAVPGSRGGERLFEVSPELARPLRDLARSQGTTLFMACLAVYQLLLMRLSGQEEVLVASPVSIRNRVELEPLVGFFVNNLQVLSDLGGDPTFLELLGRVREATLAAFEFQELPLDLAVRRVNPDLSGNALLRVMFSLFQEVPPVELAPRLVLTLREAGNGTARTELFLFLEDRLDGGFGGRLEYSADLFDDSTVERIEGLLLNLLKEVAADPKRRLSELQPLPDAQVVRRPRRNRRALPAPGLPRQDEEHVAPRNAVEEALAAIWCEVLDVDRVGVHDNFFQLGGHSLMATQVQSRIRQRLKLEMPLPAVLQTPTVASLAEALTGAGTIEEGIQRLESRGDRFPVSFSQLRLWLLDRMEPGTPAYNIPLPLRLDGPVDRQVLEDSLAEIVRRHEGLRTVFAYEDGEPVQVIVPGGEIRVPLIDLSALPEAERDGEAERLAALEMGRGFDLSQWPLLRATLVRREPRCHDLLFIVHHSVSDGWSMGVLFRELGALYEAFSAGRPSPLPELPLQYPDFAVWQRRRLQGPCLDSLLDYWRGQLADAGHVLDLPTDRKRPPVLSYRGAHESVPLPPRIVEGLQRQAQGRTTFMLLLGAMQAVLSRWTGQDDFCVGTFIANRNRAEIEKLIGFFVNTLVLRADLGGCASFDQLLDRVREVTLGAYAHQDLPLERLFEALQPKRDPGRTPVFQVMLNLHNMPLPPLRFGELTMSYLPTHLRRSNFDLTFWFQPHEDWMEFDIEYSTDLFDRSTIQRLQGHFIRLLDAALAHPQTPIARLPLLGEEERRQVLSDWNRTAADTGADVPVHVLFEAQARRVPDKPAVEAGSAVLTYAELDRRSTALARWLRARGVGPESVVGVQLRRSPEMIVALLGVLKAGGAYLPLDPSYPRERLDLMIQDAGVRLVLTSIEMDEDAELPAIDPSNLAYVIFTSGSTGRPKGVMVTHRSLANHTASAVEGYEIRESDRILQFASLSFDTSAEEIWPCFAVGATLVLRDDAMLTSAGQFLAAADRLGITVLNFPTAFWHEIASGLEGATMPPAVRLVIVGGERMLADRIESWFRGLKGRDVRLVNGYGPTEGTIVATRSEVTPDRLAMSGEPLMGRPIHNAQVYVLDREGESAFIGVPGELYIGGMGVARGYLGRPELTAERFVPDPLGGEPGARLYRTGDRVRWLASGELDFLGRVDQQVKIRGFRVEVGEVEEALRRLPGVRDAVVEARPDGSGTHRLVAWVVGEAGPDLRGKLKESLPDYMVPSAFVPIPEIPKTPSNKIDRKALPEPEPPRPDSSYAEPRSELERVVSGIWQQVLGVPRVGAHDNFFDLGGHSLLMVQAHGRLCQALGRDLDILLLFQRPTVSALARELSQKPAERPAFTQAQEMARHQRQVNTGRKQFMEQMMKQRKSRP